MLSIDTLDIIITYTCTEVRDEWQIFLKDPRMICSRILQPSFSRRESYLSFPASRHFSPDNFRNDYTSKIKPYDFRSAFFKH